jgi:hypothetical protein
MATPLLSALLQQRVNDFARMGRRRWGDASNETIVSACETYAKLFKRFNPEHAGSTYSVETALRAFHTASRRATAPQQRLVS